MRNPFLTKGCGKHADASACDIVNATKGRRLLNHQALRNPQIGNRREPGREAAIRARIASRPTNPCRRSGLPLRRAQSIGARKRHRNIGLHHRAAHLLARIHAANGAFKRSGLRPGAIKAHATRDRLKEFAGETRPNPVGFLKIWQAVGNGRDRQRPRRHQPPAFRRRIRARTRTARRPAGRPRPRNGAGPGAPAEPSTSRDAKRRSNEFAAGYHPAGH